MTRQTWTLCDVDRDIFLDTFALSGKHVPEMPGGWSVTKHRLRGGLRDGVDVIDVVAGPLAFTVVPMRGMGIWRAQCGPVQLGWKSPVAGPVHPSFVRLWEPSGIGWLDGFDELLVRCGLESNGAPEFADGKLRWPLHGKIANQPARKVEIGIDPHAGEIAITGVVDEARMFGNKLRMTTTIVTRLGDPAIEITDRVENCWTEPSELELLYHVNFGVPLLEPGGKVVLPIVQGAPRDPVAVGNASEWDTYGPESPGTPEAVFFFELAAERSGRTRALLQNKAADRGVSLMFNKWQLPYFALWKNRQAASDGYVTGLEPAINFPNRKSFEKEKGRVAVLQSGESRTFELRIEPHLDAAAVARARDDVASLQSGTTPRFHREPNPEWSAS